MPHLDNFTTSIKEFPVDRNISAEGLGARAHIWELFWCRVINDLRVFGRSSQHRRLSQYHYIWSEVFWFYRACSAPSSLLGGWLIGWLIDWFSVPNDRPIAKGHLRTKPCHQITSTNQVHISGHSIANSKHSHATLSVVIKFQYSHFIFISKVLGARPARQNKIMNVRLKLQCQNKDQQDTSNYNVKTKISKSQVATRWKQRSTSHK